MKITKLAFGILATTPLLFAGHAKAASLIGDTIDIDFFQGDLDTPFGGTITLPVIEGTDDAATIPINEFFNVTINPEAESIVIDLITNCDCEGGVRFFETDFTGAVFSDFDWMDNPRKIVGVEVLSELSGVDDTRVTFDSDLVRFNIAGLTVPSGSSRVTLNLETETVPEPFSLFGTSLAMGLGLLINKQKKS